MNNNNAFCLKSNQPASWEGDLWKEGFPAGNGKIGISVYGAVKDETIIVNHGNLWHWGIRDNVPDVAEALAKTRAFIEHGDYKKANGIIANALIDKGYKSGLYYPCPVGSIKINMEEEGVIHGYQRLLNMENGEIQVSWRYKERLYTRKCFVSRKKDMIVLKVEAEGLIQGVDIKMQIHDTNHEDAEKMKLETEITYLKEDGCLVYLAQNKENQSFGMAAKILESDGGSFSIKDNHLCFKCIGSCTIIFKVFGEMDGCKTYLDAIRELNQTNLSYEQLLSEHEKCHKDLFHSVNLNIVANECIEQNINELLAGVCRDGISPRFCQIMWNFGRYLFISGTGTNMLPFNMYGLWAGRYRLLWSHNMANINIQMMYWHCVTGGYTDYIRAFIDYYCDLMPDFRENAKKVFGMDGIFVPAGTTPGYGLMNQVVPVIVNWIGGAGWIAAHMYEYYLATNDEEYLNEKIIPFMKEAALFYEQYLVWKEGEAHVIPSVSPENTPGNLQDEHLRHMAHACPTTIDSTMDVAIIKELTSNLLELVQNGKCDNTKIDIWEKMNKALPEYKINKDGAVKEWLSDDLDDFYYHRHLSHIYPLFPGKEVLGVDDEIKEPFAKAVSLRVLGGQTGWSLASQACIYARLQEGNKALECLELLAMGCLTGSLLSLHNDWRNMGFTLNLDEFESEDKAPIQLDANMGFVNAIQEMILQFKPGKIIILPALPTAWRKGNVEGFGFIGGTIDIKWNLEQNKTVATIYSQKDQKLIIDAPIFDKTEELHLAANEIISLSF